MRGKLLPLLGALVLVPAILALQYTPQVVSYTKAVPSAEDTVTFYLYLPNITNVSTAKLKLEVYVYKLPYEELVYYTEKSYTESDLGKVVALRLYPTEWSVHDDGIYKVVITGGGYIEYTNNTVEGISVSEEQYNIYIKPYVTNYDIDLVEVSPDLSKVPYIERKEVRLLVTVRNDGLLDIDDARVCLEVFDNYGGLIEKTCTRYFDLASGEKKTIEVTLDGTKLEYGKEYTVVIYAEGAGEKEEKTYNIKVGYPNKIEVVGFDYSPLIVKPGDYVLLRFYIKNEYNKNVVITPIVISYDLNLYKELDSVTLEPLETKEIKAVIKIPKDYKEPTVNIFLKLRYDGSVIQYTGKVYVKTKKPEIEAMLIGPTVIEKSGKLVLKLTNLEEDIKHLIIDAYLEGGVVSVSPSEVVLGGKGDTKEVTIEVTGYEEGEKILKIVVRDAETGKAYEEITKELKIVMPKATTITKEKQELPTIPPQYLLAGAAIVIAGVAVYLALRGPKEERPS